VDDSSYLKSGGEGSFVGERDSSIKIKGGFFGRTGLTGVGERAATLFRKGLFNGRKVGTKGTVKKIVGKK